MSKTKKLPKSRDAYPKLPVAAAPAAASHSHAIRETVESIVIAFVLAFLFRTFEAEAFVIPTGSMAPTLMGRHKDVECPQCGHRMRVNSSEEDGEETLQSVAQLRQPGVDPIRRADAQRHLDKASCLAGMCPNCHFVAPMRADLPPYVPERRDADLLHDYPSYNGDRILVNKYIYTYSDPQRWDVVVFKFPGNAQVNYIKRLVGLPGETVRVFQGDLFTKDGATAGADFDIAAKPPDKVLAMRQLVHDTDYDPADLHAAGWPLRWEAMGGDGAAADWRVDTTVDDRNVRQRYTVDAGDDTAWLRYRHTPPTYGDWRRLIDRQQAAKDGNADSVTFPTAVRAADHARLITDFNAYNTRVSEYSAKQNSDLRVEPEKLGLHWVGDLMVEADVEVESAQGELIVDLVEGGKHFSATFDLATGRVVLGIDGFAGFSPSAETPVGGPGKYRVALANFDDQLLLWVDGKLISFDSGTQYDADAVFGDRSRIIPRTSDDDSGDLAPVGIGARNAKLAVTRLVVWRDIYYIADSWDRPRSARSQLISDFDRQDAETLLAMAEDPSLWSLYRERRQVDFPLGPEQYFVMGDNSPESSDARLWLGGDPRSGGRPGGAYLDRDMLIGKALCVYWPHSWNQIPGTPIPFPLFPNVEDMRLVR